MSFAPKCMQQLTEFSEILASILLSNKTYDVAWFIASRTLSTFGFSIRERLESWLFAIINVTHDWA